MTIDSIGEKEMKLSHSLSKQEVAKLIGVMIANDVTVTGFHKQEGNLETLFMRVTGGSQSQEGGDAHAVESNR